MRPERDGQNAAPVPQAAKRSKKRLAMKIVCILGSPREDGNSAAIAEWFMEAARENGAEVASFALNKLTYDGCQACLACKKDLEECCLDDGLTAVLNAVKKADALVLATPTYYGDVSSQLKAFIDRTFSFLVRDYLINPIPARFPPGKKFVFIQTQGDPDETHFADVFPKYEGFFKWYGFEETHLIRATGLVEKQDVKSRDDLRNLTLQTARSVVSA